MPETDAQHAAHAARQRCKTARGVWAYIRRLADAEGAVAELKNEHGLHRARCHGTGLFHVQLLLASTALNVKRLTSRTDTANRQAAGPATAHQEAAEAAADAIGVDHGATINLGDRRGGHSPILPAAATA